MSYRNSERKTQEMHATIALAVAVARVILRRLPFCDEEDIEEDVKGSIVLLSLVVFACGDDDVEEARFSLAFFSNGFFPIHFAAL